MTYKPSNATYALNSYVWKLVEANFGWKKSDYSGAVPIIPSAQQPELLQTKKPFIVYGSAAHPAGFLYVEQTDSITYNVYATSSTTVNDIINLLRETFDRQDEAAADVNEWLGVEAVGRGTSRNVSFHSVRTVMSERAEPADEEGGYVAGFIMVETRYITTNEKPQTTGFTYTA